MILEALDRILGLQSKAVEPTQLAIPDPRTTTYVIDGKVQSFANQIPPRDHRAGTLADIIAVAKRFAHAGSKPAVWYDADRVVVVIDDDGHRIEQATLSLSPSDLFTVVATLRGKQPPNDSPKFQHTPFVRLLRVTLLGALAPAELLDRVEQVRFDDGLITRASNKRNRESWGADIEQEVSTEVELPQMVTLELPVYKTPGETDIYPIRCQVETLPSEKAFQLIPYPDEIERAKQLAVASIGRRLTEAFGAADAKGPKVFIYQGKP